MELRYPGVDVYLHTSERMSEVPDHSAALVIGASVYLGKDVPWHVYEDLYKQVYVEEGWRILRPDGCLVTIQTDAYMNGEVLPRNVWLPVLLHDTYRLLDVKVWQRRKGDLRQVPFSLVHVWGGQLARRPLPVHHDYFQGIWDYPQTAGGHLNAYPEELCQLLVRAFTEPGDLIVDPFAGTGRLLGVAAALGRRAIGYEVDPERIPDLHMNIARTGSLDL